SLSRRQRQMCIRDSSSAKATDLDYLMYKLGDVELAEDGSIKDLDSKIKDLQTNHPTFFKTTEPEQADNGFKTLGGVDIPPGGKIDPSKSLTADFESAVFGK
ncbi:phage scaffolding protein, partial [Collinsella sp. Sow4_D11]|uniref:phage scaffolding protein n=1 Tax=Collinsella sp. Sow4_D11 TaxID=3438775 RepID=UPI003F8E8CAE